MRVARFPLSALRQLDPLVKDYLAQSPVLVPYVSFFADQENFKSVLQSRRFNDARRTLIYHELKTQNRTLNLSDTTCQNIELIAKPNTYTVTTGHQLCLFTGPMYFVFKIFSAIRLSKKLSLRFPEYHFVPIYWMASEDHDLEEVNHVWLYGNRYDWKTAQTGDVGSMHLKELEETLKAFGEKLGLSPVATNIKNLLKKAYSHRTLAEATRFLVNELFGKYGIVTLDGNSRALKHSFGNCMKRDLLENVNLYALDSTNKELTKLGYKTQINARAVNLFYLESLARNRIEKQEENRWIVLNTGKSWSKEALIAEIEENPEKFSPNVLMRPLYQEYVLPNVAYVGGPSEIAYWLQLKRVFEANDVDFPILVLRDSAVLLTEKHERKLSKLGLLFTDIFKEKNALIKGILNTTDTTLDAEKLQLKSIFANAAAKAKNIEQTLEATVNAEMHRQLTSLESIENKMLRALKAKEESKLNQLEKLLEELLPDGELNERKDNYFQYLVEFGGQLTEDLLNAFDPLAGELKVVFQS